MIRFVSGKPELSIGIVTYIIVIFEFVDLIIPELTPDGGEKMCIYIYMFKKKCCTKLSLANFLVTMNRSTKESYLYRLYTVQLAADIFAI